jgi:hypothetical protein
MFRLRTYIAGMASAVALGLGLAAATPAAAADTLTYIDFVGTCGDCAGYGLGVLTLKNFTGGAATVDNFVDFTYASNLVTFDVTRDQLNAFTATFDQLPGEDSVEIVQATQEATNSSYEFETKLPFETQPQGLWSVDTIIPGSDGPLKPAGGAIPVNNDVGTAYTYFVADGPGLPSAPTGVPEPAAWALMILGFSLTGASLRRRRLADAVG